MKKHLCLLLLVAVSAPGQPTAPTPPTPMLPVRAIKVLEPSVVGNEAPKLTKFNLDFPGGNPKQLVAAIEKATGRPLNVVIPDEYANESISALRMNQVTVPDLFRAMEMASLKTIPYRTSTYGPGSHSYQQLQTSLSFQTGGSISDDSIWYFRGRQQPPDFSAWETKPVPVKMSRFYALTPYLEQGLKVEDITTAIQTGWKMLGEKEIPNISFHQETKLLIAVGEPGKLETIDAVLNALRPGSQLGLSPPGSFSDRLQSIIQRATPVQSALPKTNAAAPKPVVTPEREP